jgi:uncharacterized peroxidase-related enzyme
MARLAPQPFSPGHPDPVQTPAAGSQARLPLNCNFLRLLGASPPVLEAYLACEAKLAQGRLSPRERELIALTVAEINGSKYCLSAHYALGKQAGLTDQEMRSARKAAAPDARSDAMLRFVREVTLQRGDISEVDFQTLRHAGFGDAEITEIIAHISLNIFTNYFNGVVLTEIDFPLLKPGVETPRE